jgi:SOS response regulatory protein OraA/RecX
MTGDKFKITVDKKYKVFDLGVSPDDPMDEPDEQQLYGWLRSRGFSDEEAGEIIKQVDERGEHDIVMV